MQLCSIAEDNPEILLLKIDWDENREICKALGIKVRSNLSLQPILLNDLCSHNHLSRDGSWEETVLTPGQG